MFAPMPYAHLLYTVVVAAAPVSVEVEKDIFKPSAKKSAGV